MTQPPSQPNPFAQPEPGPAPVQPPTQPAVPSFIPPSVAFSAAAPKARKGVSAGSLAFGAAIVIAAAGLGFAGGRLTAPTATSTRGNFGGNFAGGNFPAGSFSPNASGGFGRGGLGFGGALSVAGQVTAVANGSITIQTAGGQSVTLEVPSTVTYHTQAAGAASDVVVGSSVEVSATRPNARPDASGQPAANGQQGGSTGQGGFTMTVTDITVLPK